MASGHGRKHQDLPCDIKWKVEISLEFLPYEEISFHRRKYIEKSQSSIWPVYEFCPHYTLLRCVTLEKLFNLSEPLYLSNNDDNYNFKSLLWKLNKIMFTMSGTRLVLNSRLFLHSFNMFMEHLLWSRHCQHIWKKIDKIFAHRPHSLSSLRPSQSLDPPH